MIEIAAVGDLMLGDSSIVVGFGLHSRYPEARLSEALVELAPRLHCAHIALGNLESPLTTLGHGDSAWERDQMRGDAAYARVLREAGFTAISVGNNHAMQHGETGFWHSVEALRDAGILVLGLRGRAPWHAEPATYTHPSGETVALLAYSWRPRQYGTGETPYAEVVESAVLADVTRARETHDSVVVSLHWGVEFVDEPSVSEVQFAHALAAQGADLVIGHHPHVVRPVERVGASVIAYSLGNCLTDMLWMEPLRSGLLLEASLDPRVADVRLTNLRADAAYRVRLASGVAPEVREQIAGLAPLAYGERTDAGLRRQQAAAYLYLARNAFRYPPATLATLVGTTIANKGGALLRRLTGSKA